MLPNLVVIGAAKAGTTALYWYLAEHPRIFMSPLKETNFFAYGTDSSGRLLYGDPDLHKFPITTMAEYEALFSEAGDAVAVGEASPIYLECPQTAERIRAVIPNARIVCGLRHPVDRAYSDYQMYLRARGRRFDPSRDLSLDAAWAQPDSHWVRIGKYHELLTRYFDAFPPDQIHVYLFDDLREDPGVVLADLYRFLGVDDAFVPDLKTPHNIGGLPERMVMEKVMTSKRLRHVVQPWLPGSLVDLARRVRTSNLRKAPSLPDQLRTMLTDYFRDDISSTGRLIGRDLGHWLE